MTEHFTEYEHCTLCPRNCGVNRYEHVGFCGEPAGLSIDSFLLHFGEEPPITHKNGSGTVFFNGCSLRCPYCQNMQISQQPVRPNVYTMEDFVAGLERLIEQGAENLNFVTPDHYLPHIIEAVKHLRRKGINIPTVYNCSGYDTVDNLKAAAEVIDIFLFDYKYADRECAAYCGTPNYPDVVTKGLDFILNTKGNLKLNDDGKAISGIIVRHLVLPTFTENSVEVLNNLYFDYGNDICISIMAQYDPMYLKPGLDRLSRRVTAEEYEQVVSLAENLGFRNAYIQDLPAEQDEYTPDFTEKSNFGKF